MRLKTMADMLGRHYANRSHQQGAMLPYMAVGNDEIVWTATAAKVGPTSKSLMMEWQGIELEASSQQSDLGKATRRTAISMTGWSSRENIAAVEAAWIEAGGDPDQALSAAVRLERARMMNIHHVQYGRPAGYEAGNTVLAHLTANRTENKLTALDIAEALPYVAHWDQFQKVRDLRQQLWGPYEKPRRYRWDEPVDGFDHTDPAPSIRAAKWAAEQAAQAPDGAGHSPDCRDRQGASDLCNCSHCSHGVLNTDQWSAYKKGEVDRQTLRILDERKKESLEEVGPYDSMCDAARSAPDRMDWYGKPRSSTFSGHGNMNKLEPRMIDRKEFRGFRRKISVEEGVSLKSIERLCFDGRVFGRAAKGTRHTGSVLVDRSGSMYASEKDVKAMIRTLPLGVVADYCGGYDAGSLRIVARRGKVVLDKEIEDKPHNGGGNVVDMPAIEWLARQPRPRFWVSDGCATGKGDTGWGPAELLRGTDVCRRANIVRFPNIELFGIFLSEYQKCHDILTALRRVMSVEVSRSGDLVVKIRPNSRANWRDGTPHLVDDMLSWYLGDDETSSYTRSASAETIRSSAHNLQDMCLGSVFMYLVNREYAS